MLTRNEIKREQFRKLVNYRRSLYKNPELQQLAIELTLRCNCACLHCGSECTAYDAADALSDDEILLFMRELKKDLRAAGKKAPFVFVTGGEPMLRPGIYGLMSQIYKMGYNWGMTTNGTLIDSKAARALKNADMISVGVSIDGRRDTHDWFRRTPGSYDKAMSAIEHLVDAQIKHVMVTTVVHKRNINELESLHKIIKGTGCHIWRVINMEPIGRALDHPELRLDSADYRYLLDFIENHNNADWPVHFGCNHFLGFDRETEVRPWLYMCQSGTRVMSVQVDGSITGCLDIKRDPRTIQGNVRHDRLYDVWRDKFDIYRRDKALESAKCKDCEYINECDGGGFHTWDVENSEPLLCMVDMLRKDFLDVQ